MNLRARTCMKDKLRQIPENYPRYKHPKESLYKVVGCRGVLRSKDWILIAGIRLSGGVPQRGSECSSITASSFGFECTSSWGLRTGLMC